MIIRFVILLLFFALPLLSAGQYMSDGGRFSVVEKTACAPYGNPIVINAPECDGVTTACSIDFDQGDGVPNTLALVDGDAFSYVYTDPGTYIIRIQFGTTGGFDQIEMNILPNEAPDFNIYTCSGNRVQIEITDTGYSQYSIDYENDGTTDDTAPSGMVTPSVTYPNSTPKSITVRPDFVNCTSTTKTVTPVPGPFAPPPPVISELSVSDDNTVQLALNTAQNFYYQLDISTNSATGWSNLQSVAGENSLSLSGLNPDQNYYCFRMGTINICDGAAPVYTGSNVICSADLDLTIQDDLMQLDWSTSLTGVSSFTIMKSPGGPLSMPATTPLRYSDTDVVCGTTYSYQLINEYGGGIRSYSKIVSGTASSTRTPATIDNITSVITGNSVTLTWLQDPGFISDMYQIFRVVNDNSTLSTTTPDATYTDSFDKETDICYVIRYSDICGNQSGNSNTVCPMELDAALLANNAVSLTWTDYNGWANGVSEYVIEKYDASGQLVASVSNGTSTSYTDTDTGSNAEQIYTYRILAIASDGVVTSPSVSNSETIIKSPNLVHPTAFIPNSPLSENQTFRVLGNFINSYELKIFNRWGELIFESLDKETGWDGTFRGQRMPEGTYVFQARITDQAGRSFEYAGTVVLLKKG